MLIITLTILRPASPVKEGGWQSTCATPTDHPSKVCLTVDSQVHCVLSVSCGEGGVFADVGGLIREAKWRESDGGVFKSGSSSPHRCVLEGNAVPVGRGHRHTQGWICYCHVLLCAVHQFLPCYLKKEGWFTMEKRCLTWRRTSYCSSLKDLRWATDVTQQIWFEATFLL